MVLLSDGTLDTQFSCRYHSARTDFGCLYLFNKQAKATKLGDLALACPSSLQPLFDRPFFRILNFLIFNKKNYNFLEESLTF